MSRDYMIKLATIDECDFSGIQIDIYLDPAWPGGCPPSRNCGIPPGVTKEPMTGVYRVDKANTSRLIWFIPHTASFNSNGWWRTWTTTHQAKWTPGSVMRTEYAEFLELKDEVESLNSQLTGLNENSSRASTIRRNLRIKINDLRARQESLSTTWGDDLGLQDAIDHLSDGHSAGVKGEGYDCWLDLLTGRRDDYINSRTITADIEESLDSHQARTSPTTSRPSRTQGEPEERRVPEMIAIPMGREVTYYGSDEDFRVRVGDLWLDFATDDYVNSLSGSGYGAEVANLRRAAAIAGTPEGLLFWDPDLKIGGGFVPWNRTRISGYDAMTDRARAAVFEINNLLFGDISENDRYRDLNGDDLNIQWGSDGILNELFNYMIGVHVGRSCNDQSQFRTGRRFGRKTRLTNCQANAATNLFRAYREYGGNSISLSEDGRSYRWDSGAPVDGNYPTELYRDIMTGSDAAIYEFNQQIPSYYRKQIRKADDGFISNNSFEKNIYKELTKNRYSRDNTVKSLNRAIRNARLKEFIKNI